VPSASITEWSITGTTVVDVVINGEEAGRRSLKPWDGNRWFLDVTQHDCQRLRVDTGSMVTVAVTVARRILAPELRALLARSAQARRRWEALTAAQQRMLRENVLAAKSAEARRRRVEKELLAESAAQKRRSLRGAR
jgi:hypothetical protein